MGKNIYEILNDVKINEDEYEKINLAKNIEIFELS